MGKRKELVPSNIDIFIKISFATAWTDAKFVDKISHNPTIFLIFFFYHVIAFYRNTQAVTLYGLPPNWWGLKYTDYIPCWEVIRSFTPKKGVSRVWY